MLSSWCNIAVLLMALYPLLPESPHFLAVNGRLLEAQDVLHRISHWNGRPLPPGQLVADKSRKASAGEFAACVPRWHASPVQVAQRGK